MASAARLFVPPQQFPRLEANVDASRQSVEFVAQLNRFQPEQRVVVPFLHLKQCFYAILGLEIGAIQADPAAAQLDPLARAVLEYDRANAAAAPDASSTSGGPPDPTRDPSPSREPE